MGKCWGKPLIQVQRTTSHALSSQDDTTNIGDEGRYKSNVDKHRRDRKLRSCVFENQTHGAHIKDHRKTKPGMY